MTKHISATEARVHFGEVMRQVVEQNQAIIVERAGEPQVAIVPVSEYHRLRRMQRSAEVDEALQRLAAIGEKIRERRKTIAVPEPEEIIQQMREERDAELLAHLR